MKEIWKDLIFKENGITHNYKGIYKISKVCKNKRKSTGGYVWKYVKDCGVGI